MFKSLERENRRRLSLRAHLILLVLGAVLPLLIFGAVMFWRHVELQRAAIERGMRDTARALSLAVDREVGKVSAVLETLATSQYLDSRDFKAFHELSSRIAANREGSWVVLFDHTGQQIINTRQPLGASLPNVFRQAKDSPDPTKGGLPLGSAGTLKKVLETGKPVVSDLFLGITSKQPTLSIEVPVARDGRIVYVLSMGILPENLSALLQEQKLPTDWVAAVIDRRGMIIGRTLDPERFVGRPAKPKHAAVIAKSSEGWDTGRSLEGVAVEYAFARSKATGWTTDVAVSEAVIYGPVRHSMRLMAGGAALLFLLVLGAALALGRRISVPIASLARSAEAIQRGEPVAIKPDAVREVAALHSAMLAAAETSRQLAAEQERAVIAERMRRLAEVSATLAESIDFEKTLTRLADLMVPDHADWCLIDLLQVGSSLCRRVAVRTSREDKDSFAREFIQSYPPDLSRPHSILRAVETGETDYDFDPGDSWAISRSRDERHLFLLQQMEISGVIIVPLRVQGRVAGTFSLVASRYSGRKYSSADVEFAEEVSRRASVALDNAWLHGEAQRELSERRRAEEALRESEERFRSYFELGLIGMAITSATKSIIEVNDEICEILGYERSELLQRNWEEITHPADLPADIEQFNRVMAGKLDGYSTDKRFVRKDGRVIDTTVSVKCLRRTDGSVGYLVALLQDITERKQTERRRHAHFAINQILAESPSLSDAMPRILQTIGQTLGWEVGGFWILDADANVLRCLKAWHDPGVGVGRFMRASQERTFAPGIDLPGRVWTSLKPVWISDVTNDDNFPRVPFAMDGGLHTGFAFPILFGDKFLGVMEFFNREIRETDPPLLAMFASVGIQIAQFIERKRAEDALREADRRKDEFLAMLGHELRNPLGVINMVVQLLAIDGPVDSKLDECRKTIEHEVTEMARLLDDLLDVSRIARGLIRLKKEHSDLATIVRRVTKSHRPLLEQCGIDFAAHVSERPLWVFGDRTRLAQIVGNLLHNAAKFTDPGGQVTLQLTEEPSAKVACLSIRDTGIGMERETLARVFEPFVQADRSLDRTRGGLGLGLALVKGLVELHDGAVWASSHGLGRGSEFTVRLPLSEAPPLVQTERAVEATRSRRILVIEDNAPAARSLQMLLARTGHTVEVALSGSDGLATARRFQPEVVLCDIGLPGVSGYAVAQALRQEGSLKNVYLIAVSGYGGEAHRQRALQAGFDRYLTKPVDLAELQRLIGGSTA